MRRITLFRLGSGAGFRIDDELGRPLAYVYGYRDRSSAQSDMLRYEEAEQLAALIARLLTAHAAASEPPCVIVHGSPSRNDGTVD